MNEQKKGGIREEMGERCKKGRGGKERKGRKEAEEREEREGYRMIVKEKEGN